MTPMDWQAQRRGFAPELPGWFLHYQREIGIDPLRPMPTSEEMQFDRREKDVGIEEFASAEGDGFEAIIKHRFSDFSVNEIDKSGNVVRLTSNSLEVAEENKKVEARGRTLTSGP